MGDLKLTSASGSVTLSPENVAGTTTIVVPSSTATLATTADVPTSIVDNGNATAITIDATENVGFGATPTSFYSGYTGVQVGGNGTLYGQTAAGASNNFWMSQNVRAGTDGSEKAITTGLSSQVLLANGEVVAKVAPSASADANVSWTTALTIKNDGRGLSQFTAKAWVNWDNTGTIEINDSHNVSSVTDNGTGNSTVVLANNMANALYSVSVSSQRSGGAADDACASNTNGGNRTNGMDVHTVRLYGGSNNNAYWDLDNNFALLFGD